MPGSESDGCSTPLGPAHCGGQRRPRRESLAACRGSSARRDALSGLLGVYTGSPDAEDRLLAAWESHDPGTRVGDRGAGGDIAGQLDGHLRVARTRRSCGLVEPSMAPSRGRRCTSGLASRRPMPCRLLAAAPTGWRRWTCLRRRGTRSQAAATDALIMRGMLKLYVDDLAGAIADLGVAAARLRNGMPASYPGMCLSDLSDAHFRRGDWDAAVTYAQLATSLAMDTDRPVDLVRAHARATQVLAFRGQWTDADAHAKAARAAAQRFPRALTTATAAMAGTSLAFARGDWAGVIDAAEPVRAAGPPSVGGLPGVLNWRAFEADALVGLGRLDDAERALDEFDSAIAHGGPGIGGARAAPDAAATWPRPWVMRPGRSRPSRRPVRSGRRRPCRSRSRC